MARVCRLFQVLQVEGHDGELAAEFAVAGFVIQPLHGLDDALAKGRRGHEVNALEEIQKLEAEQKAVQLNP